MAETVSTSSATIRISHSGEKTVTAIEQTTVRSLVPHRRFDMSILTDLMAALTEAGAPPGALVTSNSRDGHLTQICVQWESERRVAPEAGDE